MSDRSAAFERFTDPLHVKVLAPCGDCKHREADKPRCKAFPRGIPLFILNGDNQHRAPVAGDHGIQWSPFT